MNSLIVQRHTHINKINNDAISNKIYRLLGLILTNCEIRFTSFSGDLFIRHQLSLYPDHRHLHGKLIVYLCLHKYAYYMLLSADRLLWQWIIIWRGSMYVYTVWRVSTLCSRYAGRMTECRVNCPWRIEAKLSSSAWLYFMFDWVMSICLYVCWADGTPVDMLRLSPFSIWNREEAQEHEGNSKKKKFALLLRSNGFRTFSLHPQLPAPALLHSCTLFQYFIGAKRAEACKSCSSACSSCMAAVVITDTDSLFKWHK